MKAHSYVCVIISFIWVRHVVCMWNEIFIYTGLEMSLLKGNMCLHIRYVFLNGLFIRSRFIYQTQILPRTMLIIMANHQTFSGQFKHLISQIEFDQTDFLYSIDEKSLIEKPSGQFSILITSTVLIYVHG